VRLKAKSGNESDATEFSEDGTFAAALLAHSEECSPNRPSSRPAYPITGTIED
jgi:hypothetical protein